MHDLAIEDLSSKELVVDIQGDQMVYFLVFSAPRFVGTINTTPILRSTLVRYISPAANHYSSHISNGKEFRILID